MIVDKVTAVAKGFHEIAEIVRAEAHGGTVLLFKDASQRSQDLAPALALAGLKVKQREVTDKILFDYVALNATPVPEGTMAVVGAGGRAAVECAKGIRLPRALPRLLIPLDLSGLDALDERAFFCTKGEAFCLSCEDVRVLFDAELLSSSDHVREGLGILLARLAETTDGAYEALVEQGKCPADALEGVKRAAADLQKIKESDAASGVTKVALEWTKEGGLFSLPAAGTSHLASMLAARKTGGRAQDHLFVASYALLRLYARYLTDLPLDRAAPPDRTRNAELLKETCRLDLLPLLSRGKPYAEGYGERTHVTAEYKEDFAECLQEKVLPLSTLARLYRRAPKPTDEGTLLSAPAILMLLSLTGEAVSGYPLLRQIKMTGLLEPLLAVG